MKAVFLDKATFNSELNFSSIDKIVDTCEYFKLTHSEDIVTRCKDYDIIITNKVLLDKITLGQLPRLKLICIAATGTNNVDLLAAKSQGIAVTNIAGYAKHSVCQYIFSQLLSKFNQPEHHASNTRKGLWQTSDTFCLIDKPIFDLQSKTIALIGVGEIAKQVETVARAFGMNVLLAEHYGATNVRPERVPFEYALANADIVSLHCPLTPTTQNLVNKQTLILMKPGAILINTARGGLINNMDLIDALANGSLAHAILDVLDEEPPSANHPLLQSEIKNLTLTAHIAWGSMNAQQTLINSIGENIRDFINGGDCNRVV